MPDQLNLDLVQTLKRLRRPLEEWRRRGRRPRIIPEAIWTQAVELAAVHGVGLVAKGLGLDHAKLKAHVAKRQTPGKALVPCSSGEPNPSANFIEFLSMAGPPPDPGLGRCAVEVESKQGAKLRVKLRGLDVPGLVTLMRGFLEA